MDVQQQGHVATNAPEAAKKCRLEGCSGARAAQLDAKNRKKRNKVLPPQSSLQLGYQCPQTAHFNIPRGSLARDEQPRRANTGKSEKTLLNPICQRFNVQEKGTSAEEQEHLAQMQN
jgi:hypothetical protein